MKKYIAVGFRLNQDRSVFCYKEENLVTFITKLRSSIINKKPDFVSLRMVKENE